MSDIGEKCGVFGVFGRGLDAARLVYFGLFALQHRGQESSGIATADGVKIRSCKNMGLVAQAFSEEDMRGLTGHIAVGHNRYSTRGGSRPEHMQPILAGEGDAQIALAHNGNLPTVAALESFLRGRGMSPDGWSDSKMAAEAISLHMQEGMPLETAVSKSYALITGAFSILVASKNALVALRDRCGIRPLSLARLNGGFVFSSETCAFHPIGAEFEREIGAGEMVIVDDAGIRSKQLAVAEPKLDIFEFVYFARHDSELLGRSVYAVRERCGVELARERVLSADVIVPVPETAVPVAIGYSRASGIPVEMGLAKNRYIHRTFIEPEQHVRDQGVRIKLSPIRHIIEGKRVAIVDDSIVRGTTSRQIVKMLFDTGAREVHFLVSSPPVRFPDFYGIDTPRQEHLIAATKSLRGIRDYLGATSLQYLSYDGLIRAIGVPESELNTSCFTGKYPLDIGERASEVTFDAESQPKIAMSV
ncbi:amidophosphoribosyltransferase [Candidatus Kaiserbacteria bacterium CG10_big_fil_rev_8_21_14_0_10_59_10]|uniref:Amidophosphoribosyltransferase n=1 Tax=Candidatus Kaiserbacteria bacterium CG10_big_fil_rev_8_21_14_0_10_59_10 TaxID=1974612 RepID=A0A2H0U7K9_9BACT|nr:MAG: amidophosphoribosyltransferase [Candidatus Kaiserbacteria bacterium CG10_big_fil_rev_8_21_14_0_10_59_10]